MFLKDYKKMVKDIEVRKVIIDPSATSLINLFKQNKIAVKEADNAVIDGINLVLNWLDEERIHIVESRCKNIIREFNSYIWDEKAQEKGEDKPIKQNDHALDALRYLLQTLFPNKKRGSILCKIKERIRMITEMDRVKMIIAEGAKKGLALSKFIDTQINEFKQSDSFKEMIEGSKYFKNDGDIKKKKRIFINEKGQEK